MKETLSETQHQIPTETLIHAQVVGRRFASTHTNVVASGAFKDLKVASQIHTKVHKISPGIKIPAPIQTAAIPAILDHRRPDVLIQSPPGVYEDLFAFIDGCAV